MNLSDSRFVISAVIFLILTGYAQQKPDNKMKEFAARYTDAWCSQNPASVASFFAENGSLKINSSAPSVGREAITKDAQGFMTAFPDLKVEMDSLSTRNKNYVYYWTLTGTNKGPGGTGKSVRINGYEEWTMNSNGLIAESRGHFNEAEYNHQLEYGASVKKDTPEYYLLRPELEKKYGYTHAVKIGDDLKISGAVSMDNEGNLIGANNMALQMKNCYSDLEKILKHYGYTFDDVVAENVYTTDMAEFINVSGYRNEIYQKQFPTGTWLEVKGLALPGQLIEIDMEAYKSD